MLNISRKVIINEIDLIFNKPLDDSTRSAFMTSMTDIIYRNQQHYKEFALKVCKEQVLTVNIVMYLQKNSFLKEAIDDQLSQLLSFGFLEYWTQKFADPKYFKIKNEERGPKKLTVNRLIGVFTLYLYGSAASLLSLLLELTFFQMRKKNVPNR